MGTFSSFILQVLELYFFLFCFCLNKIRFARPDLKLICRPILENIYLLWLKHASLRDFEIVENADRALGTFRMMIHVGHITPIVKLNLKLSC